MNQFGRHILVLGLYPTTRGYAFVLFEGALAPVDWGVKELRGAKRNARCIASIRRLLTTYRPDVIVIEDVQAEGARRSGRIRRLAASVEDLANRFGTEVRRFSRTELRQCFARSGAVFKEDIAQQIARSLPVFERYLPPPRKPWMSEDPRMGLFDAAAFVLVFFYTDLETQESLRRSA